MLRNLCRFDSEIHDPMHIAAKNYSEFAIEQILTHRQGYDSSEDTWEPWKAVRNILALHSYLVSEGLAKLVPWEHK